MRRGALPTHALRRVALVTLVALTGVVPWLLRDPAPVFDAHIGTLVLDYRSADPEVDRTRMELMGASFGAPFATIAAARDPRVTRLWIAHGGGRPDLMIETGLRREVSSQLLRVPLAGLGTLLVSGPRFAPEHWVGRVAPRPVVMLNATEDERIPRESVQALWEAAQDPTEQIWIDGPHMLGSRPQILQAIVDSVMVRVGTR